jgi:hypothetical protein
MQSTHGQLALGLMFFIGVMALFLLAVKLRRDAD